MASSCFLAHLPHCVCLLLGRKLTLFSWDNSLDGEAGAFSVYTQIHSLGSSLMGTGQHLIVSCCGCLSAQSMSCENRKNPCDGFLFRNGFSLSEKRNYLNNGQILEGYDVD